MKRDLTYDGLRGWLLIVIACNHLYGSFISQVTREPFGFVSAAEGFVFLSGFVAYLVYSRLAEQPNKLKRKIWQRSLTIYGFHISAIVITFTLVALFPLYTKVWTDFFNAGNWFISKGQSFISSLLLLEQPGYHDILILYLVPMLALPFAILAIKQGKAKLVLLVSLLLWLVAPFANLDSISPVFNYLLPDININVSYFDPLSWQLYFYCGVLISYLKFEKQHSFAFSLPVKILLLSALVIFFTLKHWPQAWVQSFLTEPQNLSLVRLVNLLLVVYGVMLWMRHAPYFFTLKYPVFLGQHALPVFTFHAVVVYYLLPVTYAFTNDKWYWDLLACLFFVSLLSIPATLDKLYRQVKQAKNLDRSSLTCKE